MKIVFISFLFITLFASCSLFNERLGGNFSNRDTIEQIKKLGLLENDIEGELDEQNPNAVIELLEASGKAIIVDRRQYNDIEAPGHYKFLFDKLKGVHEDLDFELIDLALEKVEDKDWGSVERILVTVKGTDRVYSGEIYYSDNFKVSSDYFGILNRILADIDRDHRLFYVTIFCKDENCDTNYFFNRKPVDMDRFGIILLTQSQAEAIEENHLLSICCNEFDLLKTGEVEQVLEAYKEVGLLDDLDADDIELKKSQILLSGHYTPDELAFYFDSLTYSFDTETGNFEHPYEEITLKLAEISKGEFQPTAIIDSYTYDESSIFSFELNKIQYKITLQNVGDWLDLSFLDPSFDQIFVN